MSKKLVPSKVVVMVLVVVASIQLLVLAARLDARNQQEWGSPIVGVVSTNISSQVGSKTTSTTLFGVTYIGRDGLPVTRPANLSTEFGDQKTTRVWLGRSGQVFIDTTGHGRPYVAWLLVAQILVSLGLLVAVLEWYCHRIGFLPYQEQDEPLPDHFVPSWLLASPWGGMT